MSAAGRSSSGGVLSRRSLLALAGGIPLAAVSRQAHAQTDRIRFGLTPVFLSNDLELLDAFEAYLESETGYPVELITRRTYQEVTALLVSGQLDAAWICGYPFVRYSKDLELIAVPDWNGQPVYQSYLITSSDRETSSLADLTGDIHAYSDPNSNSGYLVTRALLFERNLDPARFFRKTIFTYSHRNVIRAVASGLADSGSVDGYVWEVMREIEPDLINRTKPIRKSEWLGFPPIAARRTAENSAHIDALAQALLTSADKPEGRKVLKMLRLSGFSSQNPELYEGIASKVSMLRGVL